MNFEKLKNLIIYQIYPSSFKDSNNDGWGDLKGIISKLDYLKDLGINAIWLSPIYKSPMNDMGYDISDYYEINPKFGTMEDFDKLLEEAKKRNIGIIMDLVVNHTSTEHKWFKEAKKDLNSKYRDYYFIKEGKGKNKELPPNNWDSCFAGSAWEKLDGHEGFYYMHLFEKTQADLNFNNEEVVKEVENILEFYLKKGVIGFRCDVISNIYKESLNDGKKRLYLTGREHYLSRPNVHNILKRFKENVLDKYDAFMVGETSFVTRDEAKLYLDEFDMVFEFEHASADQNTLVPAIKRKYKPKNLIEPFKVWQKEVKWNSLYLENHDQHRSLSRFGDPKKYNFLSATALASIIFTLKGTPFIYQGQEIGMLDYPYKIGPSNTKDCCVPTVYETVRKLHFPKKIALDFANNVCRDHARSPMQWDDKENSGFNEGNPTWLPVNECYKNGVNVSENLANPCSILNFYKKLIKIRKDFEAFKTGEVEFININKNVLSFYRILNDEKYLVMINLCNKTINTPFRNIKHDLFLSNYNDVSLNILKPYMSIITKLK